jgi:hypothetical protein
MRAANDFDMKRYISLGHRHIDTAEFTDETGAQNEKLQCDARHTIRTYTRILPIVRYLRRKELYQLMTLR